MRAKHRPKKEKQCFEIEKKMAAGRWDEINVSLLRILINRISSGKKALPLVFAKF